MEWSHWQRKGKIVNFSKFISTIHILPLFIYSLTEFRIGYQRKRRRKRKRWSQKEENGKGGGSSTGDSSRPTYRSRFYNFPQIGGLSVKRLSSSQPLQCRDLVDHHSTFGVIVAEFSDDGSYSPLVVVAAEFCCGRPAKPLMKNRSQFQLQWKPSTMLSPGA